MWEDYKISDMIGKTMKSVYEYQRDELTFADENDVRYTFYHCQDCCESVSIDDICGDLNDLVGSPILMAEEISSEEPDMGDREYESYTWTFYKFATIKGSVTVRWFGESNGYYSESVNFKIG